MVSFATGIPTPSLTQRDVLKNTKLFTLLGKETQIRYDIIEDEADAFGCLLKSYRYGKIGRNEHPFDILVFSHIKVAEILDELVKRLTKSAYDCEHSFHCNYTGFSQDTVVSEGVGLVLPCKKHIEERHLDYPDEKEQKHHESILLREFRTLLEPYDFQIEFDTVHDDVYQGDPTWGRMIYFTW